MNYLLILFFVYIFIQISVCDLELNWKNFKINYKKTYPNPVEELYRKGVFTDNYNFIKKHNEKFDKGQTTFTLGINGGADVPHEEYEKNLFGKRNILKSKLDIFENQIEVSNLTLNSVVPDSMNWVQHGYKNPVLDQGGYGSCFAFAAIEAVQGQYYIKKRKLIRLSQQEIVDCTPGGCNSGGHNDFMLEYIKKKGITYNSNYPYLGVKGECKKLPRARRLKITKFIMVKDPNEEALKYGVTTYGLGSINIDASQRTFRFYKSGVYYDENCSSKINHSVTLVGYGKLKNLDYWLIKNSWGDKWGEKGYINIARNKNNHCGIAEFAYFPII